MVQHIGSKFSRSKNIPLLAVAVGQSWGFQILHGHTHTMGGSGAEMHSYVTLCPPPLDATLPVSSSSPSLYLSMHWDFVDHLLLEKTPWGNRILCSVVTFLKSTHKDQLKCKPQIKLDH